MKIVPQGQILTLTTHLKMQKSNLPNYIITGIETVNKERADMPHPW